MSWDYAPVEPIAGNHGLTLLPVGSVADPHLLQTMHHGATLLHTDAEASRAALVMLRWAKRLMKGEKEVNELRQGG